MWWRRIGLIYYQCATRRQVGKHACSFSAKTWATKLAEVERKRDEYQEMFAAEVMTLDELRAKHKTLKETRETAEEALAVLASRREGFEAMERHVGLDPRVLRDARS